MIRQPLIISDHSLLRVYQNKMDEEMVQKLYQGAVEVIEKRKLINYKFEKYKKKQYGVKYFWNRGYLLTVNSHKNCLITIHKQPQNTVILKK